jgi:hypothetical protein
MFVRTCRGWHRQASDECVLKSLRALFFSFLIVLCGFIYAAEVGEGRLWALGLVERTERPRSAAALLHPFALLPLLPGQWARLPDSSLSRILMVHGCAVGTRSFHSLYASPLLYAV